MGDLNSSYVRRYIRPPIWLPYQHNKSSQTALITSCFCRNVLLIKIFDKFYIDVCATFLNFAIGWGSSTNYLVISITLSGIPFQTFTEIISTLISRAVRCWPFIDLSDLSSCVKVNLLASVWLLSQEFWDPFETIQGCSPYQYLRWVQCWPFCNLLN